MPKPDDNMHKDQKRIKDVLLPQIVAAVHDDSPEARRDCTMLNRMLIQGPDPLYLMEACPEVFEQLCNTLALTVEQGTQGVETAHWQGPGIFFVDGTGLDPSFMNPTEEDGIDSIEDLPVHTRQEILWLILAGNSDCTEDGYGDKVSQLERIRRQATAISRLTWHCRDESLDLIDHALDFMNEFIATTPIVFDENGIPHSNADHAFYVLYKQGYKAAAVHTPTKTTFWGTVPGTSLEKQGIEVARVLSPQFGLTFGDDFWEQNYQK